MGTVIEAALRCKYQMVLPTESAVSAIECAVNDHGMFSNEQEIPYTNASNPHGKRGELTVSKTGLDVGAITKTVSV